MKQRLRARVILLAAEGRDHTEIADELGISRQRCGRIRERFLTGGIAALREDLPRSGRPPRIDAKKIIKLTKKVSSATAPRWSRSLMAKATGASPSSVGRVWRKFGLVPQRSADSSSPAFDPRFTEKLDVFFGLYLGAPRRALVLCVDEGREMQALSLFQPRSTSSEGKDACSEDSSPRSTPFSALNTFHQSVVSTGSAYRQYHDWLHFLQQIESQTPAERQLHLIVDADENREHDTVRTWLRQHPQLHLHFTPSSASWLKLIELFFQELAGRRGGRQGAFRKVSSLEDAITDYIRMHDDSSEPFSWIAKSGDFPKETSSPRFRL